MAKQKTIPTREQVAEKDTWDLTPLYRSDAEWEKAYKRLEKKIDGLSQFRGTLAKSAESLKACLEFDIAFDKEAERLGSYAFLKATENVANSTYQGMTARYSRLATLASEAASFMTPEIQAIPRKTMAAYLKDPVLKPHRLTLERLMRFKPHVLSQKEERLLAMQGEVAETAHKVFEQLNDADMKFGLVKDEDGHAVELTQSSFRTLLESPKRSVRKKAFEQFYRSYEDHANTLAASYSSSVLQDVYYARVRNYPSAREAALFGDRVPVSVYDSLIEAVHDNLDTVYQYLELRRKALGVKELHFYDNYVPLAKDAPKGLPFDQAVGVVCDALSPLGSDYCARLRRGLLKERWADKYENKGKRSGAFSAGGYIGPPYMMLNYKEQMVDSMFTLAHEAGHSMHSLYSAKHQPFQYYQYKIFVAEVASTFNEQLLSAHLMGQATSKKDKAFLICREIDEIRGTVIRQTMFAEFEKIAHAIVENGDALTIDRIRSEYRALLDRYFGPKVVIDDVLELEALRIPHFYRAFYVYKYATGLSAAVALSTQVMNEGAPARKRYLHFLKSGGSDYPLDLLRAAGVDMETPEPVNATLAHFKTLVDELAALV